MPTVGISPSPILQFFDSDGNPLAGGKLYTYSSGTTTPLATYTDYTGSTPNANPLILDSGGFASPGLFLQALAYTFALFDANNVPQWSQDGVVSEQAIANGLNQPTFISFATPGAGQTFTIPANVGGVKVTIVGGGGAGGGGTSGGFNGGGGGAGSATLTWLSGLTPGLTISVTVGAGGTGVSGAMGNAGSASSIASGTQTITPANATGGGGGFTTAATSAGAAASAAGSGGQIAFGGTGGVLGTGGIGGTGGGSIFGGGGAGAGAGGIAGNDALGYGSGGGGASGGSGSNHAGGAGFQGIVIFEMLQ